MDATVADLNPKTLENAKRQFVELYGSALVMNTYLKIALVLVSLVALGLMALNFHTASKYSQVRPLVVRIDEVGRAEAVQYDAATYLCLLKSRSDFADDEFSRNATPTASLRSRSRRAAPDARVNDKLQLAQLRPCFSRDAPSARDHRCDYAAARL